MSKYGICVKTKDGKIYENPIYKDEDWFICFDDDDPVELVIKTKSLETPREILNSLNWPRYTIKKGHKSYRNFNGNLHKAEAFWIDSDYSVPFPNLRDQDKHYGTIKNIKKVFGSVYYGFKIEELK